jgi:hypothetical protein
MQGRPEGGGSFGNGLLHSRPLPRRRMNQRPHAFPTLLHGPDSRKHHRPLDHITNRRRWVNQPQVPLLKQCTPQPALHLSADSLSDRTLPESMLPHSPWAPEPTAPQGHGAEKKRWHSPATLMPLAAKRQKTSSCPFFHRTGHNRPKQPTKVVITASTCSRVAAACCNAWTTNRRWA